MTSKESVANDRPVWRVVFADGDVRLVTADWYRFDSESGYWSFGNDDSPSGSAGSFRAAVVDAIEPVQS